MKLEVKYDVFCVQALKLQSNQNDDTQNQSVLSALSQNESQQFINDENTIEAKYNVNNLKNFTDIEKVEIQVLQVCCLKDTSKGTAKKVIKYVHESLFLSEQVKNN